ncbi:hypothetical protein GGS26DRAFT_558549 [Hypomontagnella submonticulosa]|nr:hypothetical protein GGS26DRAFT_558549 [Hypomontagnella submonticulosa]
MAPSGPASDVTFSTSPPSRVRVGEGFRIKIRAPSNTDNGAMAIVTLVRVSSSPGDALAGLLISSDLIEGNLIGNWKSGAGRHSNSGRQFDTMEFKSIKINQPGRYYLKIQIYGAPTLNAERSDYHVEHLRDLESEKFYVGR